MNITTFLISVFCMIDDWLKNRPIRQRSPKPRLADSEVLTMEVIGEFLGINTHVELFTFFQRYYGDWFPAVWS